jgi:N12 class adenine-specific DNA methylase
MKMNKQTIEYINSLVEEKSKKKLSELKARRDAISKKEDAVINAARSNVDKVLTDAAKKVEAIYRKHGITPTNWCGKATKVGVNVSDEVRVLRSEFAEELASANEAINSFGNIVYKKQTEVIAKLSLGGTAEDLDKIIGAIEF